MVRCGSTVLCRLVPSGVGLVLFIFVACGLPGTNLQRKSRCGVRDACQTYLDATSLLLALSR